MDKTIQKKISDKLNLLPVYNQLAFGVMLTERYLPNYFAFHFVENWGNPMILLNGIDLLKNIVRLEIYDPVELQLIDNYIEEVTPDMDEFPSNLLASLALDVSSMLHECFRFANDKRTKNIELCSQISFDSLEMYIQKKDNLKHDLTISELNEYFSNNNLIKNELDYQLNLLDELIQKPKIDNKLYIEKTLKAPKINYNSVAKMSALVN